MPFLAGTNILLRLAQPDDPDYSIVRGAVDTLVGRGEKLCYAAQNLSELKSSKPSHVSHLTANASMLRGVNWSSAIQ